MNAETNPISVSSASQGTFVGPSFGMTLSVALAMSVVVPVCAWVTQLVVQFPSRSHGASLTAVAVVAGLVIATISVPIAIAKLVKHPELRTRGNIILTSLAALPMLLGVVGVFAVVAGA